MTRFREVLGRFATGVSVVSALEDGLPVGFTCQAFASLSLRPPMVVLVGRPSPRRAGRAWCARDARVVRAFGPAGTLVIDGVLARVECAVGTVHDAGDHELVTGRVLELGLGEGSSPLFYPSNYGRICS